MIRKWIAMLSLPLLLSAAAVQMTACTWAQRGAGIGAASGGILGAIIGHQSGHRTEGALLGAAAGGLAGALTGDALEERRDRRKEAEDQAREEELRQRVDQLEEENRQLRGGPTPPPPTGNYSPPPGNSSPPMPPPPATPGGSSPSGNPGAYIPPSSGSPGVSAPSDAPPRPIRYLKKRIAVAPVDLAVSGPGIENYARQLHAMLITELRKTNRYIVVERENLDDILTEQELAASGRVAAGTGPEPGRLMGAQIMIRPQITDFENQSYAGRNVGVGPVDFGRARDATRVSMDVRVYDTETGVVVASQDVSAEKVASSQDFSVNTSIFRWDDEKSQNSTLGYVSRELIREALDLIDRNAEKVPWTATVMKEDAGRVYFNAGALAGVRQGDRFQLVSRGEALRDPDTGEVLATEEDLIGEIEVAQVDQKYSIGYVTERSGEIKRGDRVVLP